VPNGPPIDRGDLQTYLGALKIKLHKNAGRIPHPDSNGSRTAAVRLTLRSDGTVKSLNVLDEADQKDEVAFTVRLLELSAPYAPFPPSLAASIQALAITFCVKPEREADAADDRNGQFGC
jgi:hypothetical protein